MAVCCLVSCFVWSGGGLLDRNCCCWNVRLTVFVLLFGQDHNQNSPAHRAQVQQHRGRGRGSGRGADTVTPRGKEENDTHTPPNRNSTSQASLIRQTDRHTTSIMSSSTTMLCKRPVNECVDSRKNSPRVAKKHPNEFASLNSFRYNLTPLHIFISVCEINRVALSSLFPSASMPRFFILASLSISAAFLLQGSANIVALNLEESYRSAES